MQAHGPKFDCAAEFFLRSVNQDNMPVPNRPLSPTAPCPVVTIVKVILSNANPPSKISDTAPIHMLFFSKIVMPKIFGPRKNRIRNKFCDANRFNCKFTRKWWVKKVKNITLKLIFLINIFLFLLIITEVISHLKNLYYFLNLSNLYIF